VIKEYIILVAEKNTGETERFLNIHPGYFPLYFDLVVVNIDL
jgi:hypothetical protein